MSHNNFFGTNFLLGGMAGVFSEAIMAPINKANSYFLFENPPTGIKYSSVSNCLVRLAQEQGILYYWNGFMYKMLKFGYFSTPAIRFAIKDYSKRFLPQFSQQDEFSKFLTVQLASGGITAVFITASQYPIDHIRHVMIKSVESRSSTRYNSMTDCFKQTIKGPRKIFEIYRGVGIHLLSAVPYSALYFGLFDSFHTNNMNLISTFILAQITSFTAKIVSHPFATIKRLQQEVNGNQVYSGIFDCCQQTVRKHGFRELFKGSLHLPNLIFTRGLYLFMYCQLQNMFNHHFSNSN